MMEKKHEKLRKLLFFLGFGYIGKDYKCSNCGHVFPKATAKRSGGDSYPHGRHVHCPKCLFIVDYFLDSKKEKEKKRESTAV